MTSEEIVEKLKEGLADIIQNTDLPQGDAVILLLQILCNLLHNFLRMMRI